MFPKGRSHLVMIKTLPYFSRASSLALVKKGDPFKIPSSSSHMRPLASYSRYPNKFTNPIPALMGGNSHSFRVHIPQSPCS